MAYIYYSLKRQRSLSEDSDSSHQGYWEDDEEAVQGAEVLRVLKLGRWSDEAWRAEAQNRHHLPLPPAPAPTPVPATAASHCRGSADGEVDNSSHSTTCDSAVSSSPKPAQAARAVTSPSKFPATRSYVWRGPSRRAPTPSSAEPEVEDGAGDASGSVKNDRDKEWAALTTWLRMNLHQPRTTKRVVLFTGAFSVAEKRWIFSLNEELTWDDVSPETKLRLRTLPDETAAAFARKYPNKPVQEWLKKTQKYKLPCPDGSGHTVAVPLGDMIHSLCEVYHRFEGAAGSGSPLSGSRPTSAAVGFMSAFHVSA